MLKDEMFLCNGQFINYTHVVFENVAENDVTPIKKESMSNGRLFLTNQRILLLSAEVCKGKLKEKLLVI